MEESSHDTPTVVRKRSMKSEYPNRRVRSDKQLLSFYTGAVSRLENILSNNEVKFTLKQNKLKQKMKTLKNLKHEYEHKVNISVEEPHKELEQASVLEPIELPTKLVHSKPYKTKFV